VDRDPGSIVAFLFDDFETLDLFGPVEVFGHLSKLYTIRYCSLEGGIVASVHGVRVETEKMSDVVDDPDLLIVPGGIGTRACVTDRTVLDVLRSAAERSTWVLTVCTGSGLLAATGLLDGRSATSNKIAFDWVRSQGRGVRWQPKARWVIDGKYYTSSGVSAGIDMALGFIGDILGINVAEQIAAGIEYIWNHDADNDSFAVE